MVALLGTTMLMFAATPPPGAALPFGMIAWSLTSTNGDQSNTGAAGGYPEGGDQRVHLPLGQAGQVAVPHVQFSRRKRGRGGTPGGTDATGGGGVRHRADRAGRGSGGGIGFDTSADPTVRIRVGISYVSATGTQANLDASMAGANGLHDRAERAAW
ncbi:hypothetical protein ACIBI9_53910 [Nonomuraea sp. NPDC050451]|uniref:hypothetical protein n=1 Tax=Nonomuraea sp. NPDC050451 TaxID=3364364 RepID=UPI00378C84FC